MSKLHHSGVTKKKIGEGHQSVIPISSDASADMEFASQTESEQMKHYVFNLTTQQYVKVSIDQIVDKDSAVRKDIETHEYVVVIQNLRRKGLARLFKAYNLNQREKGMDPVEKPNSFENHKTIRLEGKSSRNAYRDDKNLLVTQGRDHPWA